MNDEVALRGFACRRGILVKNISATRLIRAIRGRSVFRLEGLGDFFEFVALDDVVDFVFVEVAKADPAFHAIAHFGDVVGETAQGLEAAVVDGLFAAEDAGAGHCG